MKNILIFYGNNQMILRSFQLSKLLVNTKVQMQLSFIFYEKRKKIIEATKQRIIVPFVRCTESALHILKCFSVINKSDLR
jgi:hypothetical protein